MANRLSFSQIRMWTECGEKYRLHYVKGFREKYFHSALAYGSAIDEALNTLLETRDLEAAKTQFDKTWAFQWINKKYTSLAQSESLVYAEKDLDFDLLHKEDFEKLSQILKDNEVDGTVQEVYANLKDQKSSKGFDNLNSAQRQFYNYTNWLCLSRKGHVMLDAYNKKILPRIKNVLAVQHKFELANEVGDTVLAIADLIVEWEDGSIILLDNKTSAREYEDDQASRSQQLIVYYHQLKEQFKLDKVGFIVLSKNIAKNKIKICSKCGHDGSGSKARSCDVESVGIVTKRGKEVEGTVRCGGEWLTHCNPDCFIQTIINNVSDTAEDHVLSSFDEVNEAIKKGVFYKNLSACKSGALICQFFGVCWKKNDSDIIKTKEVE